MKCKTPTGCSSSVLNFFWKQDTHPDLVLLGDLCQAIFEWSGATPESVSSFVAEQGLTELPLTANFRSSQRICDVIHRFSSRSEPDRALGEDAAVDAPPELWRYSAKGEADVLRRAS